jgi:tape measure domain-containing protein
VADGDKATFIVELIEKIRGPANRAAGAMGKLLNRLEKVRRKALAKTFETTKEIATLGTIAAGAIGAAAVGMAVSFADFAQRSMLGLQQLAKHGASAAKLFDHIRGEAELLGLDVKDTTKQFVKFLALQFDPKMATDFIRMGADLRAFGTADEAIGSVFNAIGKIKAQGKVQGDEFAMLTEAGISAELIYKQLGKTLGKTTAEVVKMQEAGKLSSDIALPAILEAVKVKLNEKELGDMGKKIADSTLGGMTGRLKAQMQNALTDVGLAVEGPLTAAIKPVMQELGAFLKDPATSAALTSFILDLVDAFQTAMPFIREFISSFSGGFMEAAPAVFEAMAGALSFMSGSEKDLMTNTKLIAKTLGELVAFGLAVAAVFGGLVHAALTAVSVVVQAAIGAWDGLIKTIGQFVEFVEPWFTKVGERFRAAGTSIPKIMFEIGRAIVEGLVGGINALVNLPFVAIDNIATGIKNRLKSVLGIHSPSTEFRFIGEMSVAGLAEGLSPMNDMLQSALPANTNAIDLPGFRAGFQVGNPEQSRTREHAMGPVAASFAEPPRLRDLATRGVGDVHSKFAPVFHIQQQPGQSSKELADDIEARMLRMIEEHEEELALAAGADD